MIGLLGEAWIICFLLQKHAIATNYAGDKKKRQAMLSDSAPYLPEGEHRVTAEKTRQCIYILYLYSVLTGVRIIFSGWCIFNDSIIPWGLLVVVGLWRCRVFP